MNLKRYYIRTTIMTLLISPAIISVGGLIAMFTAGVGSLISIIALVIVWVWYIKRAIRRETLPDKISQILMPVFISFAYYMLIWVLLFGISGFSYSTMNSALFLPLFFATLPYFAATFFIAFVGLWMLLPVMYAAITLIMMITILLTCAKNISNPAFDKLMLICIASAIVLSGVSVYQFHARSLVFIDARSTDVQQVGDEVDVRRYRPFADDNHLVVMPWEPTVVFTENFPRLDGATAAYPVFAAIAQSLYVGLDAETVGEYVSVSRTDVAYERLISGEIDVFFGAQPSEQQLLAAQAMGVEFTLTPIAKEAFVFFVHRENPVDSLTLDEIQDIYQRRITNWRQVGGRNERILPFQRPENSGSQTIMLAAVMGDAPMTRPLQQEWIGGMGELVASVAAYRNYHSAIGYSFRYFVTGMRPHEDIKLLAINGIAPTPENIRTGTYPVTVNVYAITAGTTNENADLLIQWLLSEQGQSFIELCGIVPR